MLNDNNSGDTKFIKHNRRAHDGAPALLLGAFVVLLGLGMIAAVWRVVFIGFC